MNTTLKSGSVRDGDAQKSSSTLRRRISILCNAYPAGRTVLDWLRGTCAGDSSQMAAPTKVTLVAGDVVKLTFPGTPDLNQSQKIRTDGKINLPLIGEVDAAGRSISKLQEELASRYKPQVKDSTVIVTLESSVTQVVVSGAVSKPAKLVFDRPTTVFQAIMEAGGTTEYGSMKNIHIVRLVNGQQRTLILDLRPTLGGARDPPVLRPRRRCDLYPPDLFLGAPDSGRPLQDAARKGGSTRPI